MSTTDGQAGRGHGTKRQSVKNEAKAQRLSSARAVCSRDAAGAQKKTSPSTGGKRFVGSQLGSREKSSRTRDLEGAGREYKRRASRAGGLNKETGLGERAESTRAFCAVGSQSLMPRDGS
jgi:hypothetical protein